MQQNLIDAARAVITADRAGELTDEHIQALEAAANAEAVPVAHKLLRKNHSGQWVDDGRYWIDGPPDEGLMENVRINPEQWTVQCAYSHSLNTIEQRDGKEKQHD